MNEPTVCAVMLTANRPELARRAVECFRAQTYPAKRLLILDSGKNMEPDLDNEDRSEFWVPAPTGLTIGALRNEAAAFWTEYPIIVHWDDDDTSHPNRIAEQVALLQSSGADCVGYNQMLFWDQTKAMIRVNPSRRGPDGMGALGTVESIGEAWLYRNPNPGYTLGTSLCYWRKTWERKPFPAANVGEDLLFCTGLNCVGITSMPVATFDIGKNGDPTNDPKVQPRMIARIHAGNTSTAYEPAKLAKNSEWRRVPEWDAHCRSVMEAA